MGWTLVLASMIAAGGQAYSASQESAASKKAANTQKDIAKMEIEAANQASTNAADEARAKLKLRQASRSKTILSDPNDPVNTNESKLGV